MGMQVNKKQLAEIFGISERSFTEYQRDPSFPILVNAKRGAANTYDTADVHEWLVQRAADKGRESQAERYHRLRGDQIEIDNAERTKRLVPADDVERRLTDVAIAIRTGIMTGNGALKNEIDLAYDINLDIDLLNDHARHILTHLSAVAGEPAGGDPSRAAEPAAAEADVEQ